MRFLSPHLFALAWALFSFLSAYAYVLQPYPQLARIEHYFPIPIWSVWAIAAMLCLSGAVPWVRCSKVCRLLRIAGIAVIAFMLIIKAFAFWTSDFPAEWVSAKNYFMLAAGAFVSAYFVGRQHAPIQVEQLEQVVGVPTIGGQDESS